MNSPATIPERSEIAFRDPKKVETVLTDYAASNLGTLQVALSLNADVFAEAKICRHFFAHRTENTFREVKAFAASMGMFQVESTEQLVLQGRPSTGVQFVDGWLSDIHNFFDLAT